MNERERQPDQAGYLDFRRRVEEGRRGGRDVIPAEAGIDWLTPGKRGAPGQYFDLYCVEDQIRKLHAEPPDRVLKDLQKYLPDLRDEEIHPAAREDVDEILLGWQRQRADSCADHDLNHDKDVEREAAHRQKERPSETMGQSWFRATVRLQGVRLERLESRRRDVEHELRQAIREGQTRQLGDPGYAEWREQMRQKNAREGREARHKEHDQSLRWELHADGNAVLMVGQEKIARLEPNTRDAGAEGWYVSHIENKFYDYGWHAVDFRDLPSGQQALQGWANEHAVHIRSVLSRERRKDRERER